MKNMKATIKGTKLHLEIDLAETVDKSSRGNDIIAATNNWEELELPEKADDKISSRKYSFRGIIVAKKK